MFGFHGKKNAEFTGSEAGDFSGDSIVPINNRWVYEDKNVQISKEDVLNYWLYVQHGRFGYRLDNQKYPQIGTDFF